MPLRRIRNAWFRWTYRPALRLFRDMLQRQPDPVALRKWVARIEASMTRAEPGATVRPVALPHCQASWFDVEGANPRKAILYLHGGAFIFETPRLHGAFLTRLARACGVNALMPNYRLAPEHRFPAAPDDALSAYRWLLAQGYRGSDIVVAGDSAGGNLALGLLQRLNGEGLPQAACAVVLSPVTDGSFSGDSVRRNDGLDPMFTARGVHALAPLYLSDAAQAHLPLASPLLGDMTGLPPVLLIVGSSELLLDDSVRFALRCPSAQLQVWHDMPHVFALFDFLPQATQALESIVGFVRAAIERAAPALPPPVRCLPPVANTPACAPAASTARGATAHDRSESAGIEGR